VPEFLVRIETRLPQDLPEAQRAQLLDAESARGRELLESGKLRRIWRVPGRTANVSLYDVADADELHELLSSLPRRGARSTSARTLTQSADAAAAYRRRSQLVLPKGA